jgi:hypothetical protein
MLEIRDWSLFQPIRCLILETGLHFNQSDACDWRLVSISANQMLEIGDWFPFQPIRCLRLETVLHLLQSDAWDWRLVFIYANQMLEIGDWSPFQPIRCLRLETSLPVWVLWSWALVWEHLQLLVRDIGQQQGIYYHCLLTNSFCPDLSLVTFNKLSCHGVPWSIYTV